MHCLLNFHAIESSFINPKSITWFSFLEKKQLKQKFQTKAKANFLMPISSMLFQIIYKLAKIFASVFMSIFKVPDTSEPPTPSKNINRLIHAYSSLTFSIHLSMYSPTHQFIYPSTRSVHLFFHSFIHPHFLR